MSSVKLHHLKVFNQTVYDLRFSSTFPTCLNSVRFVKLTSMVKFSLHNSIPGEMLQDGVIYTLSIELVRTVELSIMAKPPGFDGFEIEMKHSNLDLDTTNPFHSSLLVSIDK
jgi:hypothetical protein